jgi:hypothetical protein
LFLTSLQTSNMDVNLIHLAYFSIAQIVRGGGVEES